MLIWPRAASMLFVVTLVVVCGGLWGLVDRLLRHAKSELPVAVVAGRRARGSRLFGLVMVLGLAGLWWQCSHSTNIVVVSDGDDGPIVTRGVWLGAIDGYAKAAGHAGPSNDGVEWIDNRSSTQLLVDDVDYGYASSLLIPGLETTPKPPPHRVAPDTMYAVPSVDFVGPSPPPSEIVADITRDTHYVWLHWPLTDHRFSERVPLLQPPLR